MNNAEIEVYIKALSEIAAEEWHFRRIFERAIGLLDVRDAQKVRSQYAWFIKSVEASLDTVGLRIVDDLEGQDYDAGMAVSPLNLCDYEPNEPLIVEQMIEPIIMLDNKISKKGAVILGRAKG